MKVGVGLTTLKCNLIRQSHMIKVLLILRLLIVIILERVAVVETYNIFIVNAYVYEWRLRFEGLFS